MNSAQAKAINANVLILMLDGEEVIIKGCNNRSCDDIIMPLSEANEQDIIDAETSYQDDAYRQELSEGDVIEVNREHVNYENDQKTEYYGITLLDDAKQIDEEVANMSYE